MQKCQEFRDFAAATPVYGMPARDSQIAEAGKQFHIESFAGPTFIAINAQGEVLGVANANQCGAGCTQDAETQLPPNVVAKLNELLARTVSVNALEAKTGDGSITPDELGELIRRYEEANRYGDACTLLEAASKKPDAPLTLRETADYFAIRNSIMNSDAMLGRASGAFREKLEGYLMTWPDGAHFNDALGFSGVPYMMTFNAKGKMADFQKRMRDARDQAAADRQPAYDAAIAKLDAQFQMLAKSLEQRYETVKKAGEPKDDNARRNLGMAAAAMGDAEAAVKNLEGLKDHFCQAMLEEAKAALSAAGEEATAPAATETRR